jgi:hypothetical protein
MDESQSDVFMEIGSARSLLIFGRDVHKEQFAAQEFVYIAKNLYCELSFMRFVRKFQNTVDGPFMDFAVDPQRSEKGFGVSLYLPFQVGLVLPGNG